MTQLTSLDGTNDRKLPWSCQLRCKQSLCLRALTAALTAWFWDLNQAALDTIVPLSSHSYTNRSHYCSSEVGSLQSIAMDMIHYSSPPGSKSFNKLKHVLNNHSDFYIDLASPIFQQNEENMASLLEGYGLNRLSDRPDGYRFKTLLVETVFTSSTCPLTNSTCQLHGRILIQSEQIGSGYGSGPKFINVMSTCNNSSNCIVLEFSDYNYEKAIIEPYNWGDSFILLPVMTQSPSRLMPFMPETLKDITERSIDIVFFGAMTTRRNFILEKSSAYINLHPEKKHIVEQLDPTQKHRMANTYKDAKVCLVAHSYSDFSGGEYHRLSDFANFGCIPVMERFADSIGIERYEKCGGVVFVDKDELFETAIEIVEKVDQGYYNSSNLAFALNWWNSGIDWEKILPTVYSIEKS